LQPSSSSYQISLIPATRRGTEWTGLACHADWFATIVEGVAKVDFDRNATGPASGRAMNSLNLWEAILVPESAPGAIGTADGDHSPGDQQMDSTAVRTRVAELATPRLPSRGPHEVHRSFCVWPGRCDADGVAGEGSRPCALWTQQRHARRVRYRKKGRAGSLPRAPPRPYSEL
jgi:hypothetical protein